MDAEAPRARSHCREIDRVVAHVRIDIDYAGSRHVGDGDGVVAHAPQNVEVAGQVG